MTNGYFFINGAAAGTDTSSAGLGINNNQVVLGNAYTANEGFDGHIDEIRISNTNRSAAWIKADHYSQSDGLISWSSTAPSGGYDLIDTTSNLLTQGISSVASGDNVHLAYIDGTGQTKYRQRTYSWQTPVVIDDNNSNTHPNISIDTSSTDLYLFWERGGNIYYKQGLASYDLANWDETATSWQSSTALLFLTAGTVSGGNNIFVMWRDDDGLTWDAIPLSSTIVSVTITTDGVIDYGTLGNGDIISTLEVDETQTAQNDGTVAVDLNIKTIQPSGWTLGSTSGSDTFVYEFSTTGGSSWTAFTSNDNYQTLTTNLATTATLDFDLRLTAPSPTTTSDQKTITTVIQAVQN
jgi:hypothetical protein